MTSAHPPSSRTGPNSLLPAAIIFGIWAAVLIGLALSTANPVTLNRRQIADALLIIEGRTTDDDFSHWSVSRSWPNQPFDEPVEIRGLQQLSLNANQAYLIPLEQQRGTNRYRVVRSPKPRAAVLVYPSTPETVANLERILSERRKE